MKIQAYLLMSMMTFRYLFTQSNVQQYKTHTYVHEDFHTYTAPSLIMANNVFYG